MHAHIFFKLSLGLIKVKAKGFCINLGDKLVFVMIDEVVNLVLHPLDPSTIDGILAWQMHEEVLRALIATSLHSLLLPKENHGILH